MLARVASPGGALELRRRGESDFLIVLEGRVLMTSAAHRSECALAEWVCKGLAAPRPRVLIGGLGMGYTLRAALDALPPGALVCVAELEPAVVEWCRGPLAPLCEHPLDDPRVELVVGDVMQAVRAAATGRSPRLHAIALDLYQGPRGDRDEEDHPLYGRRALALAREALAPGGALGVWSEQPAAGFARRLERAGLVPEVRRAGRGGRRHVLYRGVHPLQALAGDGRNTGG